MVVKPYQRRIATPSQNFHPYSFSSLSTRTCTSINKELKATLDNERSINGYSSGQINGSSVQIHEVDVRHGSRISLTYDPTSERYIEVDELHDVSDEQRRRRIRFNLQQKIKQLTISAFLPDGVTDNYYNFIKWRIIQRYINANVHVFGTQSLLMGLGITNKSKSALGLSAALNWVLKDALGKIVRMIWASRMGRKFDPDAKRWRYRSSLLYALGNGLEVCTYVFPSLFLILATMANSLKQMSMLTSTSTRNALYNSFRDGTRENLGDITAKGEAQIAIVDLFGILSGVLLSRTVGTSVQAVLTVWVTLQIVEVSCVYKQLRSVVFRMLNFERLWFVTNSFIDLTLTESSSSKNSSSVLRRTSRDLLRNGSARDIAVPTPDAVAQDERIFLPPHHLARRGRSFGSFGRAKLSPEELQSLIEIFRRERFMLVVGRDVKNPHVRLKLFGGGGIDNVEKDQSHNDHLKAIVEQLKFEAEENCHIVLHVDANNADIVKSTLALAILRRKLSRTVPSVEELKLMTQNGSDGGGNIPLEKLVEKYRNRRTSECIELIQNAREDANETFGLFLKVLSVRGWTTPARSMFGRVTMRADWPRKKSSGAQETIFS